MKKKLLLLCVLITNLILSSEAECSSQMELWGTNFSPFVRKVVNVISYKKGLEYTHHQIFPTLFLEATNQKIPEEFLKASPLGKIPVLTFEGHSVADSAVIVAFLERQYPRNTVYPASAKDLADALWLEKYADTQMTEVIHQIFVENVAKPAALKTNPDKEKVAYLLSKELPKVLGYLNNWLAEHDTRYLVGNELTIADFAVANHFVSLEASQIKWRTGEYSSLEAYYARMLDQEIFSNSIPDALKG